MGASGSISLGIKFGIVLGCLIALAFGAGLVKLWIDKRRLKNHIKLEEQESTGKSYDKEKAVGGQLDAGDLFGVSALEHGHFGGVAQSRSSSPSPSYVLSPSTTLTNWGGSGKNSASSSVTDLHTARDPGSSFLSNPNPTKTKPSPLRLQPSDAELIGRKNHRTASPRTDYFTVPLPSPKSGLNATNPGGHPKGWVSPLDVHFTRPTTPNGSARPKSYLPKLKFQGELEKTGLPIPTPSGSTKATKLESSSIVSTELSIPASVEKPRAESTVYSAFPLPPIPSRAARQSERSIFPHSDDAERPTSKRSNENISLSKIPIPPIPATYDAESPKAWGSESPIIRDSAVRKSVVSVYQPTRSRPTSQDSTRTKRSRAASAAASSVYSATTSIVDYEQENAVESQQHTRTHSRSIENQSRGRNQSSSRSHKRQNSSQSLSRTQDSLKHHSRKLSQDRPIKKRRSRERDHIHFDPASHHRNRSGSIQGQPIDFSQPRDSPFSNSASISTHSASSSSVSTASMVSNFTPKKARNGVEIKLETIAKPPTLDLALPEPGIDRLSVNNFGNGGADGRMSVQSRASLGDFYDSYYRQSGNMLQGQVDSNPSNVSTDVVMGKRLAPLKLGPALEGVALAGETIVEAPSPAPSPLVGERIGERFPSRI